MTLRHRLGISALQLLVTYNYIEKGATSEKKSRRRGYARYFQASSTLILASLNSFLCHLVGKSGEEGGVMVEYVRR